MNPHPALLLLGWLMLALLLPNAHAATATLTNATQVRELSQTEAAQRIPVRLRGVVVDEAGSSAGFVVHDSNAGVYVEAANYSAVANVRRGDLLEIEGVSDPGGFAPIVRLQRLRKVGTAPMPAPQPVTYEQLLSGKFDGQWVEVSGIVRYSEPINYSGIRGKMELATGGERLAVRTTSPIPPGGYEDAEVVLRGVCFNQHNVKRQLVSPMLHIPRGETILVTTPAPAAPFDLPMTPVASLLQFAPEGNYGHRVRVRGVVTHSRPGEFLWLREGARGLKIQTRQRDALRPGDSVDVLGFPNGGEYTPILEDAIFRNNGPAEPPQPARVTTSASAVEHDADLIELEATLHEVRRVVQGSNVVAELTFAWGSDTVKGVVQLPPGGNMPTDWRVGSAVRATGISNVTRDEGGPVSGIWTPRSFRLLLRSPADLVITDPPPTWTLERIAWVFVGLSIISMAIAVTATMLARRRLREQAARRALAEAEFAAILKERNRVAREIHDTLAQGLGAISMQLELAKSEIKTDPAAATHHVETAHEQARSSLAEARNSIWNMRSQVLENRDVPGALEGILRQLTDGTGTQVECRVTGPARRLPPVVENDLLRIGQEAITNATKHAHAKRIELIVEFTDKQITLTVKDDGCGYDGNTTRITRRGFGLVGMSERAAQLRGELTVASQPGAGTTVKLTMPIPIEPRQ